jgi:hypothetical protein
MKTPPHTKFFIPTFAGYFSFRNPEVLQQKKAKVTVCQCMEYSPYAINLFSQCMEATYQKKTCAEAVTRYLSPADILVTP